MNKCNSNEYLTSKKDYDSNTDQTFSEFIKSCNRDENGKKYKDALSTRELAERLGITYEQFRKILNMNKPTKKRDCIIAICAVLRLNSDETNKALVLYRYMPQLDTDNPRDNEIINILEEQLFDNLSIEQINQRLESNGFPKLDIIDHRPAIKHSSDIKNASFKILKKQVRSFASDLLWGDQYDSLSTSYDIHKYRCVGNMWIENKKSNETFKLTVDTNSNFFLEKKENDSQVFIPFGNIQETGEFKDYYVELLSLVKNEHKKMLSTLNDTKNYHERISANYKNNNLVIFAETFNFRVPEINEYYLLDSIGTEVTLSVYRNSEFMRRYMSDREYYETYGHVKNELIARYKSISELEEAVRKSSYEESLLLKSRLSYFYHLNQLAGSLKKDLISRKVFIRRLKYIYEDHDRVCEFYGVEKEFQCCFDDKYGDMMFAGVDNTNITLPDGNSITITIQDLYEAFELGLNTIQEICFVKQEYGCISSILSKF